MATLNTLRTKGGVILSIAIGVSLLAFLLGDLSQMNTQSATIVGEINGEEITHEQYEREINRLSDANKFITGQSTLSQDETERIQQDAWQQIVMNNVIVSDFEEMGFAVSDEEMLDMSSGNFPSRILSSYFINRSGQFDKDVMNNFIASLDSDASGNSRNFWNYVEGQMSQERVISKYNNIVKKGIFVTDLEIENGVKQTNNFVNIEFVSQPTSMIPDSTINLSNSTLKEYYKNNIAQFKQSPSRVIRYVVFEAIPSEGDYVSAREYFTNLTDEFRASADGEQFVNLNSEIKFNPRYLSTSQLPVYVGKEATDGEFFGPHFENDTYSSANVVSTKNMPDSLTIRFTAIPLTTLNIDSLTAVANASSNGFDKVIGGLVAHNPSAIQPAQTVSVNTSELNTMMLDALVDVKAGRTVFVNTGQYIQVMKVVKRGDVVRKMQLAELIYNVIPSPETEQISYSKAMAFEDAINNMDSFNKLAGEDVLLVRNANLTPDSRILNGINDSREIVRWSFLNSENTVSEVFSIGNKNIVACVEEVVESGTASFESVKDIIHRSCMSEAKAEKLSTDMKGISLSELATKYDTEVKTANDINFKAFYIPNLGANTSVIGAATILKADEISAPITSSSSVTIAKGVGVHTNVTVDAAKERALLQAQVETNIEGRLFTALIGTADIEDNRVLYY